MYDEKVPAALKSTQEWFGKIISTPLQEDQTIAPITPSGKSIQEEADLTILPSPTLKPYERIQIYNQQYWWRLLNILQDTYPFTVRIFGYSDFNDSLATPYLIDFPPNHWSLDTLGDLLPEWIQSSYTADDKPLVYDASILDQAYLSLFFVPLLPPLSGDLEGTIYLQPHVVFLQFPYDLLTFRMKMMEQEPDYWLEQPFPELEHTPQSVILYRSLKGHTTYKIMTPFEMDLLKLFQKGTTIDMICDWIEEQSLEFRQEAEIHLQEWFQDWTIRGLLCNSRAKTD